MNARISRIRLSGPAARFVSMLRDFGHLDDEGEERLLSQLAEQAPSGDEFVVDLPMVRRTVAAVLFDHSPDEGILQEDWPLLFS